MVVNFLFVFYILKDINGLSSTEMEPDFSILFEEIDEFGTFKYFILWTEIVSNICNTLWGLNFTQIATDFNSSPRFLYFCWEYCYC